MIATRRVPTLFIAVLLPFPAFGGALYDYTIVTDQAAGAVIAGSSDAPGLHGSGAYGSPTPTPVLWTYGTGNTVSDAGRLGARVNLVTAVSGLTTNGHRFESRAGLRIDELVISGPTGATEVETRLNLVLDGRLRGIVGNDVTMGATVTTAIEIDALVAGQRSSGRAQVQARHEQDADGVRRHDVIAEDEGMLDGVLGAVSDTDASPTRVEYDHTISTRLQTVLLTVPVGVPFGIDLDFTAIGAMTGNGAPFTRSQTDFLDTLLLDPEAVFDLGAGYTVNGGFITDNRIRSLTASVPAPPTAALLLAGGLACRACRVLRARKRNVRGIQGSHSPSTRREKGLQRSRGHR